MDIQTIKQKIGEGQMSNEELAKLIGNRQARSKGSFFKKIMDGFIEGYTVPNMLKASLEMFLILTIIIGVVLLSYTNKMDTAITAIFLSAILGFLFGKIK